MDFKIIDIIASFLENKIPEVYLSKLQEFLLSGSIFTLASKFLTYLFFVMLFSEIIILILGLLNLVLFIPIGILVILFVYVSIKKEKRASEIEKSAPDFLRQLSAMLQVGLSFENAMDDMSKYGQGPLYDEMRRTIVEIKMGRSFDDAWIAMAKRLNSKELERIFIIILDGRKSGSSLANVILDISVDLRSILALKRERKSSVMMSIMFLIISAVIASPFSLGMVSIYGSFMENFGQTSQIISIAPIAGGGYLIIHSILVSMIISVIMYGNFKSGIKFAVPLVSLSYGIFYLISNFGGSILFA